MEENTKEMIVIDSVDRYNEIFGLETRHPLVSIIDLAKSTTWPTRAWFRYEVYALYLKNVKCGDIKYGRQYYDYQDGTIVCFAPGQITDLEMLPNIQPNAHGILFHPDLIRGTALGQEIKKIFLLLLRNQRSTPHFRRRAANSDGLPAKNHHRTGTFHRQTQPPTNLRQHRIAARLLYALLRTPVRHTKRSKQRHHCPLRTSAQRIFRRRCPAKPRVAIGQVLR